MTSQDNTPRIYDEFSNTGIDLSVTVCRSSPKTVCVLCSAPTFWADQKSLNAKLHKTKHYMLHGFSDPSETEGTEEEKLAAFQQVRDEIKQWIVEEFAD